MRTFVLFMVICLTASVAFAEPTIVRGTVTSGASTLEQGGIAHHATLGGLVTNRLTGTFTVLIQGFWFPVLMTTDAVEDAPTERFRFALAQNTPNPFNPQTTITFVVPGGVPSASRVSLTVYDVQGRLVRILADRMFAAGPHGIVWDGTNESGESLGSGVYYARCMIGASTAHKRLVLLK